ncbi:hypothetical protein KTQ54_12990 [Komagataeibacter oboediens]|uniref:hypothetical protein n=1 Tax=Komagataeibacter oboediens TaxID=65958 RepID=UPI001C2C411D|nr:hypothetical protein [Komagataeibacter oboediens]MBV0889444.1 hypothetical protein [Komagataeibacter oboediens]MCK9818981.1 hypothetical protein [Komagataeibacter oboediens]
MPQQVGPDFHRWYIAAITRQDQAGSDFPPADTWMTEYITRNTTMATVHHGRHGGRHRPFHPYAEAGTASLSRPAAMTIRNGGIGHRAATRQ